jgi:hypothetical protein
MSCCHSPQSKLDEEKGITAASIKLAGGDMIELPSIHMLAGLIALELLASELLRFFY